LGSILARQSGASRTSPVLRGTFILEQLLGEKLPKPPPNVPRLPDDESAADGLTVRQMVERHRAQVECAVCHDRIDPFGLALEEFDAIGRFRGAAAGSPAPDARTRLPDGTEIDGWSGLRSHLLERRREQFLRQLCRKLVGYALGRSVELCDEALLDHMRDALRASEYRFSSLVLSIVQSRQFLSIRGRDVPENEL
jgi:hypothetical protein